MQLSKKIRYWLLVFFWFSLTCAMCTRLVYLASYQRGFLMGQSRARVERQIDIHAKRGQILDRNGEILAMSQPVNDLWAHPRSLLQEPGAIEKIASILAVPSTDLKHKVEKSQHKDFMYVARHISDQHRDAIKDSDIKSVHAAQAYARFYPGGKASAQLVGIVDIDGKGIEGIEYHLDADLSGKNGFARYIINPFGEPIESLSRQEPVSGHDVKLTIDRSIQYITYQALKEGAKRAGAKSAHGIVLDVQTGDIVAATNYPSYNPAAISEKVTENGQMRHKVFTDLYEPGSTFKAIAMAYILDHTPWTKDETISTSPGEWAIGENIVRDVHNYGNLNIDQVLIKSSNIGMSKLILRKPDGFVPWLKQIFQSSQSNSMLFPGMQKAKYPTKSVSKFETATLAFGYGISMTPLQLAQWYLSIANGGYWQEVYLTESSQSQRIAKQRIMDPKTAKRLQNMLYMSTQSTGTARRASVKGVQVAGKTGTTQIYENGRYWEDRHVASFAGFAPFDDPRYVIVIIVEEPDQSHRYGGQAAAPIFSKIVFNSQFITDASQS